jgi:ceramide glucosyltransferase
MDHSGLMAGRHVLERKRAHGTNGGTVLTILRLCLLVLAAAPLVYYLLALACVIDFFRRHSKLSRPLSSFTPPASIIKPVRGLDRDVYENFASFCRLDYPEYEILFAVASEDDPVIPVIRKLQRDYPKRSIKLLTRIPRIGANNKVNSLCRLVEEAKYDLLVMSDSDVRVEPDYLRRVAAPFVDARVGAATALYRSLPSAAWASALRALNMAMESAPAALVARKVEGNMQFAFGWTMATTRACLEAIGGWEAMADHHSDDFELGNRLARHGYRVEMLRDPVGMVFPSEPLRQLLRSEMRWAIGLRNVRPAGYWGLALTQGLPWSLLAALTVFTAQWSWAIAAAYLFSYLVLRVGLTWTIGSWGLGDRVVTRNLWLVPFRDALSFFVWVSAFFSDEIMWRGLSYRVDHGLLVPIRRGHDANP